MLSVGKPRLQLGRDLFLGVVLLFALVALPACAPSLTILGPVVARHPYPVTTAVPESHALALLGVDFDPSQAQPLTLPEGGVNVVAAIENQGLSDESNVSVSACLLDPARPEAPELLNETIIVKSLRAGEMRLVRFTGASAVPLQPGPYRLTVELAAVRGETDTSDNRLVYDVSPRPED